MAKNLLIVESPAKAKTIEKILGKDFTVKSSFGHIRDLAKGNGAIEVDNDFKPNYIVSPDKTKVVKDLKDNLKKVDEVWIATDEDREGEAIGWHLCEVLGLDAKSTKRIVFREITASAIKSAVQSPGLLDLNLVNAQQARRILDRLVGFELSGLLWKKVRGKLSAGRVQSVSVKLIVEREMAIRGFKAVPFYKIAAIFDVLNKDGKKVALKADGPERFDTEGDATDFINKSNGASFKINDIKARTVKRKPTAPFTTSTLQQEASRKMGFSVKRTMTNAQRLYEQGLITYMRTDSVNLSETALTAIAAEIEKSYGTEYLETRRYKTKKQSAQEAHEAIRPSYIERQHVTTDHDQQRLYELIWKRTIASQMSDAKLEKTTVKIGISTLADKELKAEGEVMKFDGFLKVYLESKDDDDEGEAKGILPPLTIGQNLPLNQMTGTERFTRGPARYTEASLVKKLEELGIGRPSTYAPTISKIMEEGRGYVVKETREGVERTYNVITLKGGKVDKVVATENTGAFSNRLVATDMGRIVTEFLDEHFDEVMDYGFTADVENKLDTVSSGGLEWTKMLNDFYPDFHATVEDTIKNADRASGERILGIDPESGRTVLVRLSKYGPVVQIGKTEELAEGETPRYANLMAGQSMDLIEFDEAIKCFRLPRDMGEFEGEPVIIGAGRFGPYVKWGEKFISLAKGEDPMAVDKDRAIELIEEKKRADAPVHTYDGLPVTQGAGRFGPFLKWNEMFINIPRRYDPDNLEKSEMDELIAAKIEKEANRIIQAWPEHKVTLENARWGPVIKFKKKKVSIPKKEDGKRVTSEEAKDYTWEDVKALIEAALPGSFKEKKPKKKPAKKKVAKKK